MRKAGFLPSSYRWVILIVVFFTYAIVFMPRLCIPALSPFIRDEMVLTSVEVGFLSTAAAMGNWVMQLPSGVIVDRLGPRWIMFAGLMMAGVFMVLTSRATAYPLLLLGLFTAGFGSGCLATATAKMVMSWFPVKERATVMGIKQSAFNVGGMLSAGSLPALAIATSWRFGFIAVAGVCFFAAILGLILYREPRKPVIPIIQPALATKLATDGAVATAESRLTRQAAMTVFKNPDIIKISLAGMLILLSEWAAIAHTTLFLKDALLYSVVIAGGMLAFTEGTGAVAKATTGVLSDRLFRGSRKIPWLILSFISVAAYLLIAFLEPGRAPWTIYAIYGMLGIGAIGWSGLSFALVAEFAGPALTGIATGFNTSIMLVGTITGPPLFGLIIDLTGSYKLGWIVMASAALLSTVLILMIREDRRIA